MRILDPFVLPADVSITPLVELPSELREQVGHDDGDFAVTRPRSRTPSTIVDARTAALLESFRSPTTIVDAVIAFGSSEGVDPRDLLDDAFSVLGGFVNEGVLVSAGSELAQAIASTLAPGERVGDFTVLEAVHVIVDTEVYFAEAADGSAVALKIARPGCEERLAGAFAHEAAILASLDGRVNPLPLDLGAHADRPYLAMTWCSGSDIYEAAADARRLARYDGSAALLELGENLLDAYAHLHDQGVAHGDVHPRNVRVDGDAVTIIDFGLAGTSVDGRAHTAGRGGIDFFLEPEVASARLARLPDPALSFRGEQYSLGALLYLLLTGAHTHAFSLEPEEMLRQLVEEPLLTFAQHDVHDLDAVERVLTRALAKDPADRYPTTRDFSEAFRAAARSGERAVTVTAGAQLLDSVRERLELGGTLLTGALAAPTASAMNGGAGFAYAALRVAELRDDEALLALADVWSTRSVRAVGTPAAFWNEELEIVPETFGESSFYHHRAGVHAVAALVAQARDDAATQQSALESFVAAAGEPGAHVDVAFGHAGLLLGAALLLESAAPDPDPLVPVGNTLRDLLWDRLHAQPALAEPSELRSLGAAHGWAGYLFALLRWSEASSTAPPEGIEERLDQLAALGRPAGRGIRWPLEAGAATSDSPLAGSWCNGAAGQVHLWLAAHRVLGDEGAAVLAERAGWTAYESVAAGGDLCCGFAGRAYALLSLYRETREAHWLARARLLADRAEAGVRAGSLRRDSLYKGEVGAALLTAELAEPELARMPLFEG